MLLSLDVVDLLQLQEMWSWRPIVAAFSRLERREPQPAMGAVRFDLNELMPRLVRLRHSSGWQQKTTDPARVPIRDLSESDFSLLYPELDAAQARQALFDAAYHSFVIARCRGPVALMAAWLRALADARRVKADDYLDARALPQPGSPDWIPADITDEIRGLDSRYRAAEPGTPAAYVIADLFWPLLVKAEEADITAAVQNSGDRRQLMALVEVARVWNRSPSVVGLCYQIEAEDEAA
ncbi:MAG: hypothetical protein HZC41_24835 [Chloroflexi bacterium]|nr:hypothetical protein [Chloroflexota bacterium]